MKKFIAVISILALLFCLVSAFAEGIDLTSMSKQELIELEIAIKEELAQRDPFSEIVLYPGKYVVGKDMLASDYIFHGLDNNKQEAYIFIRDSETDKTISKGHVKPGENMRFELEEGIYVQIDDAPVILIER